MGHKNWSVYNNYWNGVNITKEAIFIAISNYRAHVNYFENLKQQNKKCKTYEWMVLNLMHEGEICQLS